MWFLWLKKWKTGAKLDIKPKLVGHDGIVGFLKYFLILQNRMVQSLLHYIANIECK